MNDRQYPEFTTIQQIDCMTTPIVSAASPAGKVLAQLRHGPTTVEHIAKALRLTNNAVRNQLQKLEHLGLVARAGTRPGVSKPSALYGITLEGQIQFSTLYLPVLTQFLRVAENGCEGTQLKTLMSDTGRLLARNHPRPTGARKSRVYAAARLLRSFGGTAEVRVRNGKLILRSAGCPLAALTSENPAACSVLQGLLSEYLSGPVAICCEVGEDPRCCFETAS